MKNVNNHLCDEMLIAQASYEVIVNENRRSCSRYLVNDMMWLNTRNIQIARSATKLNDRHVDFYRVNKVFSNSLVVQLKLSDTINVYFVFHVNLLQHDVNDSLFEQISKSWEFVIAENDQREWYVNDIQNFKLNKRF
jgi:hypothetical protein